MFYSNSLYWDGYCVNSDFYQCMKCGLIKPKYKPKPQIKICHKCVYNMFMKYDTNRSIDIMINVLFFMFIIIIIISSI